MLQRLLNVSLTGHIHPFPGGLNRKDAAPCIYLHSTKVHLNTQENLKENKSKSKSKSKSKASKVLDSLDIQLRLRWQDECKSKTNVQKIEDLELFLYQ